MCAIILVCFLLTIMFNMFNKFSNCKYYIVIHQTKGHTTCPVA